MKVARVARARTAHRASRVTHSKRVQLISCGWIKDTHTRLQKVFLSELPAKSRDRTPVKRKSASCYQIEKLGLSSHGSVFVVSQQTTTAVFFPS